MEALKEWDEIVDLIRWYIGTLAEPVKEKVEARAGAILNGSSQHGPDGLEHVEGGNGMHGQKQVFRTARSVYEFEIEDPEVAGSNGLAKAIADLKVGMQLPLRFARSSQAKLFYNKIFVDKNEGRYPELWGNIHPVVRGTVVYLVREK